MKAETDAALAAMKAAWNTAQVYEAGKVPAIPVTPYAVVSVSSGAAGNVRNSGQHGSKSYRIAVQCFGKTLTEVSAPVEGADAAFLEQSLTVTGFSLSPCQSEISTPVIRDPDAGVLYGCFLTYTFHSFPTT